MSIITNNLSDEQTAHLLSEAIGLVGEARLIADLYDPERNTADHDRALMVQAGLIALFNSLGDGRPAPKLSDVHAARVDAAMGSVR